LKLISNFISNGKEIEKLVLVSRWRKITECGWIQYWINIPGENMLEREVEGERGREEEREREKERGRERDFGFLREEEEWNFAFLVPTFLNERRMFQVLRSSITVS
jgi:hypothetical protein